MGTSQNEKRNETAIPAFVRHWKQNGREPLLLNHKCEDDMMTYKKFALMCCVTALAPIGLGGCATVEEAVAEAVAETRYATLDAAQVISSRGDSDGYAKAELTVADELNQVCYDVNDIRNLGPITSITINRGARGSTGPVVLRLKEANEGGWKNCIARAEWREDSFENSPGAYFIQIATTDFPNGAIRGQFMRN